MADHKTPEDATPEDATPEAAQPTAPNPGAHDPASPDPIDWESPRWQAAGRDDQGDVEFERRYRNSAATPYTGAIDTPAPEDREPGGHEKGPTGTPDRA